MVVVLCIPYRGMSILQNGALGIDMSEKSFDILSLSGEAALVFRDGKLIFKNEAARRLLVEAPEGADFSSLIPLPFPAEGAPALLTQLRLGGRLCTLRLIREGVDTLVFLAPAEPRPLPLNDPFLAILRDILSGLSVSASLIREEAEDLENATILSGARGLARNQHRLDRIVNNAAIAANLLEGSQPLRPVPCDLEGLCASVLDAVRFSLPELRIEEEYSLNGPAVVDPELFKQLLFNLLSNSLLARAGALRVSLSSLSGTVLLRVTDNGSGIPTEQLHQVFDRYRHDFDLHEMLGGAGLGLSVCHGIAALHGGALMLESTPGLGTTVQVSFPARPDVEWSLKQPEHLFCTSDELLTGLADCLPADCFDYRFLN